MQNTAIDVSKLRNDVKPVLCASSFAIGAGEIFSIARRTGAGKTTTLKIIEGPDEKVQGNLTLPVIQELSYRVDIGKQSPAAVARQSLTQLGSVR